MKGEVRPFGDILLAVENKFTSEGASPERHHAQMNYLIAVMVQIGEKLDALAALEGKP